MSVSRFQWPATTLEPGGAGGAGGSNGVGSPVARASQTRATPVERVTEATLPTVHGTFRAVAYRDELAGVDHMALVVEPPEGAATPVDGVLVRVHSECITGEAFGSVKCECGPQLDAALELIQQRGGIVVYLRGQEGRGIGLANKMRAYRLQEKGTDTLDANTLLGFPADARDYHAAAEMLTDLGVDRVRLLTNNPEKIAQLSAYGVQVASREPLLVGVRPENVGYLEAKRDRMNHQLPDEVAG